jgi:hypothetical protein
MAEECKVQKDEFTIFRTDVERTDFKDFMTKKFGSILSALSNVEFDDCDEDGRPITRLLYMMLFVQKDSGYYIYKYVCEYNYSDDDIYRIEYKKKAKDLDIVEKWIGSSIKCGYGKIE